MRIIKKCYDKWGKLRVLKEGDNKSISVVRFKILKSGKGLPCCDFHGDCNNVAYAEVFPFLLKNKKQRGWSYLCKKHYFEEQKRFGWKLPACLKVKW